MCQSKCLLTRVCPSHPPWLCLSLCWFAGLGLKISVNYKFLLQLQEILNPLSVVLIGEGSASTGCEDINKMPQTQINFSKLLGVLK